ncbi:MAG: HigA family addiction module antitoxin [Pseudomonadota bacterium]
MESLRDPRRRPTHPGEILREDVLPALKMTQTELAKLLDVSRLSVSELVNEKRALSPDMAVRLGILFGNGPESWLRMQQALDLWEVRQKPKTMLKIKPLPRKRRGDLLAA